MTATIPHPSAPSRPDPRAALSPDDRRLLAQLRVSALRCRAGARMELSRACAMVGTRRDLAPEAMLDALLATLGEALGRSPRFFRPTARALSFDESWLLRLIACLRTGDEASATFLLHSRVSRDVRRSVVHLVARVAAEVETLTAASARPDYRSPPQPQRIAS